ncbi:hypothetical protein [Mesorhizobium sp. M0037]|uniref:hypothetical protein n=1 Tax=unclassified Mesorhizobium TaxID=325217 RepID=UPI00333D6F9C
MSDATVSPAVNEDEAALATPFVKCLVRLIRAQVSYGSWERKSDAEQLANFIATSSIAVRCCWWRSRARRAGRLDLLYTPSGSRSRSAPVYDIANDKHES